MQLLGIRIPSLPFGHHHTTLKVAPTPIVLQPRKAPVDMNWLTLILKALPLIPVVVSAVETLHKDLSGTDKKTQAQSYLGLAVGVADQFLPTGVQGTVNNVASFISKEIDTWVGFFHDTGLFTHKTPTTPPAQ